MNDYEYQFKQEVREKKSLIPSAKKKIGTKGGRSCSLPSDHLTAAQKQKLNGPVNTYAINRPMSWEKFKAMPLDLQQAHIDYLQNRFQLGMCTIGREVFSVSSDAIQKHMKRNGIRSQHFRGDIAENKLAALRQWLTGEPDPSHDPEPMTEPEAEPNAEPEKVETVLNTSVPHKIEEASTTALTMLTASMRVTGTGEEASEVILNLLRGRRVEMEINVRFLN